MTPLAAIDPGSFAAGAAAGIVATLVALTIWRSRFAPAAPHSEGLRAKLRDVRKGGVVCLGGFGDDGDDLHLYVDTYARCERDGEAWHELEGDYRGRRVGLEWQEAASGVRVVAYRRRRAPLEEIGLDPKELERLERTPGATVDLGGVPHKLEKTGDARRLEGGHAAGVPLRTWDLAAPDQHAFVRVERDRDGVLRASTGRTIAADAVEIFRVKAERA